MNKSRLTTVRHCARCGLDHEDLLFKRFASRAIEDCDGVTWDWWGTCPTYNEPILQRDMPELNDAQQTLTNAIAAQQPKGVHRL